jgi:uncharacterized protein involved in cysteine biosynthesis
MAQLTRAVTAVAVAIVALAVAVPLFIELVNALIVPVSVVALLVIAVRVVWVYTGR